MIRGNIKGAPMRTYGERRDGVVGGDVGCIDEDAWYAKVKERRSDADQPKPLARLFLRTQS